MELTKKDKARLATELCGLIDSDPVYVDKDYCKFCNKSDFAPLHNSRHTLLVLEGLVKKTMEKFTAYSKDKACRIILHQLATMPEMPEDNWLGNLVCTAGLEVLGKDGG